MKERSKAEMMKAFERVSQRNDRITQNKPPKEDGATTENTRRSNPNDRITSYYLSMARMLSDRPDACERISCMIMTCRRPSSNGLRIVV